MKQLSLLDEFKVSSFGECKTTEMLLKAFEYGVDYGLLIADEERDSEDFYDAVICASV